MYSLRRKAGLTFVAFDALPGESRGAASPCETTSTAAGFLTDFHTGGPPFPPFPETEGAGTAPPADKKRLAGGTPEEP